MENPALIQNRDLQMNQPLSTISRKTQVPVNTDISSPSYTRLNNLIRIDNAPVTDAPIFGIIKVYDTDTWAHINIKLLHFLFISGHLTFYQNDQKFGNTMELLKSQREDGKYCDVTLSVGPKKLKVMQANFKVFTYFLWVKILLF